MLRALPPLLAVLALAAPAQAATRERGIYALLASGKVVRAPLSGNGAAVTLGTVSRAFRPAGAGPLLARTSAGLFVAPPGPPGALFRVDPASRRVRRLLTLREGLTARALVAGPRTGRLHLLANEALGGGFDALVIQTLSGDGTEVLAERQVRSPAATVFSAAVSPDERRLAVAYHGAADGFDLVDLDTLALACASTALDGCVPGHGSVHFAGSRLFTSTGARWFDELAAGDRVRRRDSRLAGNHLLEFAADRRFLYMTGACGYTGGLARLDLRRGTVKLLVRPGRGRLCGTRMLALRNRLILAANPAAVPQPRGAGRIRIVGARTGRVIRSVRTAGGIVDLATGP